jgi:hypothetical protein
MTGANQARAVAPLTPAPGRTLDWARVATWTQRVIEGDLAPIERVFASHGAAAPEIVWEPWPDQVSAPPLRYLLDHWLKLTDGIGLPLARTLNPFELEPARGYVMVLQPVEGGRDFRYRFYGSRLTVVSGFDMTGRRLSSHPVSTYAAEFAIAAYRAAMRRRLPLYTTRDPVGAAVARRWQRLALPFADASGAVTWLLCATVAIGADGTMI